MLLYRLTQNQCSQLCKVSTTRVQNSALWDASTFRALLIPHCVHNLKSTICCGLIVHLHFSMTRRVACELRRREAVERSIPANHQPKWTCKERLYSAGVSCHCQVRARWGSCALETYGSVISTSLTLLVICRVHRPAQSPPGTKPQLAFVHLRFRG